MESRIQNNIYKNKEYYARTKPPIKPDISIESAFKNIIDTVYLPVCAFNHIVCFVSLVLSVKAAISGYLDFFSIWLLADLSIFFSFQ
jgi:hypothetical protein